MGNKNAVNPKLIILSAGQGMRLRPITDNQPKCMLKVHGKPMIRWQVETARHVGIEDIVIVTGYSGEAIDIEGVHYVNNERFANTNMVETLFCALPKFTSPLVVSYGDILYEAKVLDKVLNTKESVAVAVDKDWKPYWEKRFSNVLEDAETLIMNSDGSILEIGQKPNGLETIQGQYIGLSLYRDDGLKALCDLYFREKTAHKKQQRLICPFRSLSQLYMTDLIQGLINFNQKVMSVPISGGWLEIDFPRDLQLAHQYVRPDSDALKIDR